MVRPVAFALALGLAFAAAPISAFAEEKPQAAKEHREPRGDRADKAKRFPMKADVFRDIVEKRINKAREKLDRVLDKRDLPPGIEAQIKKDFDAGVVKVRAAADKAAADGTVTKEEARAVRDLAQELRREAREKYLGKGKGREKNAERRGGQDS
jgi:hypothetical protein